MLDLSLSAQSIIEKCWGNWLFTYLYIIHSCTHTTYYSENSIHITFFFSVHNIITDFWLAVVKIFCTYIYIYLIIVVREIKSPSPFPSSVNYFDIKINLCFVKWNSCNVITYQQKLVSFYVIIPKHFSFLKKSIKCRAPTVL